MRERVQPKMCKVDIDYQKLHNAFFKFQTKPTVFGFGEGKNSNHQGSALYRDCDHEGFEG